MGWLSWALNYVLVLWPDRLESRILDYEILSSWWFSWVPDATALLQFRTKTRQNKSFFILTRKVLDSSWIFSWLNSRSTSSFCPQLGTFSFNNSTTSWIYCWLTPSRSCMDWVWSSLCKRAPALVNQLSFSYGGIAIQRETLRSCTSSVWCRSLSLTACHLWV